MLKENSIVLDRHNLSISYLDNEESDKKILLFVHGWQADKNNLKAIFNYLQNIYRIISIDLPGFGGSTKPDSKIGSIEYAEYIFEFLDKLNIKKICLVGHSLGGKIGIILAANHKNLVEKLVLIDSAGIRNKRSVIWYIKVYQYKILKFIYKQIFNSEKLINRLKESSGSIDYRNAGVMREILVNITNEDFSDLLSMIDCPVFLYWGEKDKDTPLWMAKKMNRLIKDSALYVVKNGSHFSFLEDNRIINIIKSFY